MIDVVRRGRRLLDFGVDAHLLARTKDRVAGSIAGVAEFTDDLRELGVCAGGIDDGRDARARGLGLLGLRLLNLLCLVALPGQGTAKQAQRLSRTRRRFQ